MDWVTVINTAVGIAALFLGGFSVWLALHLYTRAKDAERETSNALIAIKTQSEALQRLTGRWMDRFTRYATEPRPTDQGLMQLVQVVASLPTTILAHLRVVSSAPPQGGGVPPARFVDACVGLYYYTAFSNVLAQALLPAEDVFNATDPTHAALAVAIDRTAADFVLMANMMGSLDTGLVASSSLQQTLKDAVTLLRPNVRNTTQVFEARRAAAGETGSPVDPSGDAT